MHPLSKWCNSKAFDHAAGANKMHNSKPISLSVSMPVTTH